MKEQGQFKSMLIPHRDAEQSQREHIVWPGALARMGR